MLTELTELDKLVAMFDQSLRAMAGIAAGARPNPAQQVIETHSLDEKERRHSAALMRVNLVGEVCAQALYQSQGLFSRNQQLQNQFKQASKEEEDHLAWTVQRIQELGSHASFLNPFWYTGAWVLGAVAAKAGDAVSLGFVVETERQVEAHLDSHLASLPHNDVKSRAIVEQMRRDEIAHGIAAQKLGAVDLPQPVKKMMTGMAKLMTTVAYYV